METDSQDRAAGILIGLAAGDRNGGPIRMAVRLAESLVECQAIDVHDISTRYLAWWRDGAFDTGPTAAEVFARVEQGRSFLEAARDVHRATKGLTAGCNPAHRAAPLAAWPTRDAQTLTALARQEALLTHCHPLSGDVSAAVVAVCHALVRGANWNDALQIACHGRLPETQAALSSAPETAISRGGFAPDVLAAAVYFVGQHDSFAPALDASLRFAGAANYCPVLVGSLGGARWGVGHVGAPLLEHCEILPRVCSAAQRLAAGWNRSLENLRSNEL